ARSVIFTILIVLAVLMIVGYIYTKFRQRKQRIKFSPKDLGGSSAGGASYPSYPPRSPPSQPAQRAPPINFEERPPRATQSFQQPTRYTNLPYLQNNKEKFVNKRYPER
ncbi:MAG: hypothetical protein AABX86_00590, partial [Nanoarchaeota archaeon]